MQWRSLDVRRDRGPLCIAHAFGPFPSDSGQLIAHAGIELGSFAVHRKRERQPLFAFIGTEQMVYDSPHSPTTWYMRNLFTMSHSKRKYSVTVRNRRSDGEGFSIEITRVEDNLLVIGKWDETLHDLVTLVRALEAEPEVINDVLNEVLAGSGVFTFVVELTDAHAKALKKKHI